MNCINPVIPESEAISNILGQIDKIHRIGEQLKNTNDRNLVVNIYNVMKEIESQIEKSSLNDLVYGEGGYKEEDYDEYARGWELYNFDSHAEVFDDDDIINTYDTAIGQ
jgi:hypothetical protein